MILAPWLVWLVPLIAAPLVALAGLANKGACRWLAVAASGLTALLGAYQTLTFTSPQVLSYQNWGTLGLSLDVKVDGLSVLLAAFVSSLSFLIVVYAAGNMAKERGQARFYSLIMLFLGAMLGLVMAGNLIQLYFFWEIVGICSALLIAFWNDKPAARAAGFKAFVVTRFGDVALFIAVILLLVTIHTSTLDGVNAAAGAGAAGVNWSVIGILILIGAMGKSAQVPLHVWLPDAMEGPTPVSALIHAATMVNAGVYLVARMFPVFNTSPMLLTAVLTVGLVSMLLGAACASAAEDLKRVLAYSTISQLGLMFVGIGLGSWQAGIYQLVSQGLFKALAFMAAGSVIESVGTRNIEEMGGLRRSMKLTYVGFLFAALAMVGVPPLIGFWTKDAIVSESTSSWAFTIVLLGSLLTSYYSFRALVKVFHGPKGPAAEESPRLMTVPMMALVASVILGWLLLGYQTLIPPLAEGLGLLASSTALGVLFAGLLVAYVAFVARSEATKNFVLSSPAIGRSKEFFLQGLGFDRAYGFLARSITGPLTRAAAGLQTGKLSNNMALLLLALLTLLVLTATGVI